MQPTSLKVKVKMANIIRDLPDDASVEDAMERLLLLYKIETGIEQAAQGAGPSRTPKRNVDCASGSTELDVTSLRRPRIVPELPLENIREILHGNYRIIYRQTDDSVQILTVHHSARLLDRSQFEAG